MRALGFGLLYVVNVLVARLYKIIRNNTLICSRNFGGGPYTKQVDGCQIFWLDTIEKHSGYHILVNGMNKKNNL